MNKLPEPGEQSNTADTAESEKAVRLSCLLYFAVVNAKTSFPKAFLKMANYFYPKKYLDEKGNQTKKIIEYDIQREEYGICKDILLFKFIYHTESIVSHQSYATVYELIEFFDKQGIFIQVNFYTQDGKKKWEYSVS